jgi:hypothetical protein
VEASIKMQSYASKKPSPYKIGKIESELDESNKHSVRLAYINTIMFWIIKLIVVLTTAAAFLIKVLRTG